uniref:Uncharacterized protein n=1 Tax=Meloidogyne enterolobii TaxID=390850 RepID=A0A6V7YF81_MELEN|nr:unnamed protein product [Meloidogyne enterolobii]
MDRMLGSKKISKEFFKRNIKDSTSTRHTNLTPQHGAHGTIGSHGGSHGAIMLNNKAAIASSSSPEHQHHYNSLHLHEQHQTSSGVATPSHTPTQITGQSNGQLKVSND